MKPGLKFLNSKETKEIKRKLEAQFEFSELNYAFLQNQDNKIFIVNRDVDRVDWKTLYINSIGAYLGEDHGADIRLSIEGSQLIGSSAKKNVIELDKSQAREWLKGYDLEYPGSTKGFVIIKCGNDFLGSAKHKDSKLINYVPKERRIRASD